MSRISGIYARTGTLWQPVNRKAASVLSYKRKKKTTAEAAVAPSKGKRRRRAAGAPLDATAGPRPGRAYAVKGTAPRAGGRRDAPASSSPRGKR